jgi:hypothetical protein
MEVSFQLHDPAALPQGKGPSYPLDRRLGGPLYTKDVKVIYLLERMDLILQLSSRDTDA